MATAKKSSVQAAPVKEPGKGPIQDLRDWLDRVDEIGELIRIKGPVDCIEEMGAIGYLVAKQTPSPAILIEKTKGYENSPVGAMHLWNILGPSLKRIALTLEEPPETPTVELIRLSICLMTDSSSRPPVPPPPSFSWKIMSFWVSPTILFWRSVRMERLNSRPPSLPTCWMERSTAKPSISSPMTRPV